MVVAKIYELVCRLAVTFHVGVCRSKGVSTPACRNV
jgi:hypothetical protein